MLRFRSRHQTPLIFFFIMIHSIQLFGKNKNYILYIKKKRNFWTKKEIRLLNVLSFLVDLVLVQVTAALTDLLQSTQFNI